MADTQALWKPSHKQVATSQLARFYQTVSTRHPELPDHYDYAALHRWSISHSEEFWTAVWSFFDLKGEPGAVALKHGDAMPGAKWFPHARLNFAENLLRRLDAHIALVERGEDGRRHHISYETLYQHTARFAAYLQQQGVKKGDRVAGFLPNCHHAVVAMLATASLGAVWSSCSPDFGFSGVLDRFEQIQPSVLIGCNGYVYGGKSIDTREQLARIQNALPSLQACVIIDYRPALTPPENMQPWHDIVNASLPVPPLKFEPLAFDDPLYILYSSGTTGKPKCIVHGVGGTLLQHVKELGLHTNVTDNDCLFYYTTCGWMMWNWLVSGLALGATLVLYDGSPFHPCQTQLIDIAQDEGIYYFGASAKYYAACEKFGLTPARTHQLKPLRTLLSTGSPLAHESFDYLYREFKHDVCVSSISGGTDIVSCFALGNPTLPVYRGELQCIGLGMDVDFVDETGQSLPAGKGELICRKPFPSMPTGFWNDPDGKRYHNAYFERFTGYWAHGDYGERVIHTQPDQHGIIIHGRSDAVLNPGGVRIGTAEIYRQVEKIDEVFECIAVGQQWQDDVRIVLFVRLRDQLTLDDTLCAHIRQMIRSNTTPRHVPAKIIQVADIPKTLSGKMVELAVRSVIHGEDVQNKDALANPEALDNFRDIAELNS